MNTQKGIGRGTLVVGSGAYRSGNPVSNRFRAGSEASSACGGRCSSWSSGCCSFPLALQGSGWGAFAIPGIVTMTGLVLLFQNVFNGAGPKLGGVWALIAPARWEWVSYIFGRYAGVSGLKDAIGGQSEDRADPFLGVQLLLRGAGIEHYVV